MRKYYLILLLSALFISSYIPSYSQSKPLLGQYFQNLPAFAPALTGANDFLDIRLSARQQWAGIKGAPRTVYASAYSPLKAKSNNFRDHYLKDEESQTMEPAIKLKHGLGGYLQSNSDDLFRQLEININYAVHVPIFKTTYLSLGVSGGLASERIDISNVNIKDNTNDLTYLSYLNDGASNTYFNLSGGLAMHSERYYVSYNALPLIRLFVSGNENVYQEQYYLRQQILAGGRFYLNRELEMIPNAFIRIDKTMPLLYDAGMRLRYQQKIWTGLSYRSNDTLIAMFGLTINDRWNLSYAYEHGVSSYNTYNNGTHEIVLGAQFFNFKNYASMW